jgi:hypothetical protein
VILGCICFVFLTWAVVPDLSYTTTYYFYLDPVEDGGLGFTPNFWCTPHRQTGRQTRHDTRHTHTQTNRACVLLSGDAATLEPCSTTQPTVSQPVCTSCPNGPSSPSAHHREPLRACRGLISIIGDIALLVAAWIFGAFLTKTPLRPLFVALQLFVRICTRCFALPCSVLVAARPPSVCLCLCVSLRSSAVFRPHACSARCLIYPLPCRAFTHLHGFLWWSYA